MWRVLKLGKVPFECVRVSRVLVVQAEAAGAAADDAPDDAKLRPSAPESATNDARNEPDARAIGHKSATKATRNEPERRPQPSAGFAGRFSPAGSLWGHRGSHGASEPDRGEPVR
jgi:hypothetical protein